MGSRSSDERLDALIQHATSEGLTVVTVSDRRMRKLVKHVPADACYDHETTTIYIRNVLFSSDPERLLCVVAHEIGHAIDYRENTRHHSIYGKVLHLFSVYRDAGVELQNIPDVLADVIIMLEENAWDRGADLLEKLAIDIKPGKLRESRDCSLRRYDELFRGCSQKRS